MGQAKQACPHCERAPGDRHADDCPRSRESQRKLAAELAIAGEDRPVWVFGEFTYRRKDDKWYNTLRTAYNPGVPMVKHGPWTAGGLPRAQRKQAYQFFQDFLQPAARASQKRGEK